MISPTPDTPQARLRWEQRLIPRLAHRGGARLIHTTSYYAPLFTRVPTLISPAGYSTTHEFSQGTKPSAKQDQPAGFYNRLRWAIAQGGFTRLGAILWPEDLPPPLLKSGFPPFIKLPPVVHPDFLPAANPLTTKPPGFNLPDFTSPDRFILYHGPCAIADLRRLLEAWSWAAHPIGAACPLLLLGLDEPGREGLAALLIEYNPGNTVYALPRVAPDQIPTLYQRCTALFHPAPISPWGGPVRHALACGRPVVTVENPISEALVGSAGYLAPADEARSLGAALITIAVEESIAGDLSRAAIQRSSGWRTADFSATLLEVYRAVLISRYDNPEQP